MALPGSGTITMGNVRTELGASGTITLAQTSVRTLFALPTGSIKLTDGYGKSNGKARATTYSFTGTTTYGTNSSLDSAYDTTGTTADTTTYGTINALGRPRQSNGTSFAEVIFSGFSSATGTLTIPLQGITAYNESSDLLLSYSSCLTISYSTDGGTNYTVLGSWVDGYLDPQANTPQTVFVNCAGSSLYVKVRCTGGGVGTTWDNHAQAGATADIYDVVVI